MISRRHTREFLLQSLYARSELWSSFERDSFIDSYFSEEGMMSQIDMPYIETMEEYILKNEDKLISIVAGLAPKFELQTMPVMHILILMIALSEMIYGAELTIPEAVSVNEAIELAKKFSDDQGKVFINGTLSTFLKQKEIILANDTKVDFHVFQK